MYIIHKNIQHSLIIQKTSPHDIAWDPLTIIIHTFIIEFENVSLEKHLIYIPYDTSRLTTICFSWARTRDGNYEGIG